MAAPFEESPPHLRAYFALLAGTLCIGFSPIFVKLAGATGDVVGAYRLVIAALVLSVPAAVNWRRGRARVPRRALWLGIVTICDSLLNTHCQHKPSPLFTSFRCIQILKEGVMTMLYEAVNKVLNWGIKIASLAVTGPATWIVASDLFDDIHDPTMLFCMRASAVFLVEGVMLSNWLLLEFDKKATPGIKARYGLTALAMYIALLVIGWRHEGPTGLVFRMALLAALLGSGWDTYVYTWHKATARADRDIASTGAVRRHARRLAGQDAKQQLNFEYDQRSKDRQVEQIIADEKREQLQEQLRLSAQLEHKEALARIGQSIRQHSKGLSLQSNTITSNPPGGRRARKGKATSREQRLELGRSIVKANPELSGPEFVERLGAELRAQFGTRARVSESTAYADFALLRSNPQEQIGSNNGRPTG